MKHKVSELEGALLDAAVAKAEGYASAFDVPIEVCGPDTSGGAKWWHPSEDWEQGGPIIERERINVVVLRPDEWWAEPASESFQSLEGVTVCAGGKGQPGPTPLLAAMRAFVASRFGEEVELP